MPIYEYRCDRCGVFEFTQRITEPALESCPTCEAPVSRLISATSFQLKGSGWYVTDYARKGGSGSKEAKDTAVTGSSPKDTASPGSSGGDSAGAAGTASSAAKSTASAGS